MIARVVVVACWACWALAGCEYFIYESDPHHAPGVEDGSGYGSGEYQNDCPFGEGRQAVACTTPGATCSIYTWEHGCSCTCGSDGWWSCFEETIGSSCPQGEPDAGVPEPPPDASIDAGPCESIQAEAIADHPGWFEVYGNLHGNKGLSTNTSGVSFSFEFTGTTLGARYERGPTFHTFSISIDSATPITIDAYQPGTYDFTEVSIATGLPNAAHTATVTCTSASCAFDDFAVTCN